jgi:hypothetical protein
MKRMVMNRWLRPVLALVAAAAVSGAGCGGSGSELPPDAGTPDMPDGGMPDAGTPDTPGMAPMGSVRFLNASPLAGSLDVYLHGQTSPVMSGVPYGRASDPVALPVGSIQLDVRQAGAPATAAPLFVSDPIAIIEHGSITAIGAGLPATDPLNPPPATSAFRITSVDDVFAAAAPGKVRVRVFDAMYSLAAVAVDLGDDASFELASLGRFTVSDAAGLDVAAGSDLAVGIVNTDAAHTRVGSFVVPAAALTSGASLYLVVAGLSTFPPRDPRGATIIVTSPPGGGAARAVRPNPVIYWLAASPDAAGIDGYLGSSKAFGNLAFGKLGSSVVPATAAGYTLDIRTAGADPASAPLASLSTGALVAGQQYLAVVTGLVTPASTTDALALRVYRDDTLDSNDFGRMRIINAAVGAGTIDAGRYTTAGAPTWVDVTDFDAIPAGGASAASGTTLDTSIVPAPVTLGARLSATPAMALRFDTIPGLNPFDRFFGVLAGAWLPTGSQAPARYIIVKTAAITPWSTTVLSAVPDTLAVTPTAATVTVGDTQQYAATAVFGNGMMQDATAAASWSSLDETIAQMSTTTRGLATARAPGATTISAQLGSVIGTAAITVGPVQILAVSATQPADGATGVGADTAVSVTFSLPIDPATLVAQTADGPCSGTLQLSADGFVTCVGFGAPVIDATGTVATVHPAAVLAMQTTYKLRVLGTVTSAGGGRLGADFTQAFGFRTTCPGRLVISQVYGGGSAAGGIYRNDFIELHNSGGAPVDLTSYAVQAGLATGTTWSRQAMPSAIIPPGGYFLLQEGGGTSTTQAALPDPDFIPTSVLNLNGINHKVALSLSPDAFAVACPLTVTPPLDVTDLVGYGTANCFEGAVISSAPMSNSTSALRNDDGCVDTNNNNNDFTVVTLTAGVPPVPRNSKSPPHVCACPN